MFPTAVEAFDLVGLKQKEIYPEFYLMWLF